MTRRQPSMAAWSSGAACSLWCSTAFLSSTYSSSLLRWEERRIGSLGAACLSGRGGSKVSRGAGQCPVRLPTENVKAREQMTRAAKRSAVGRFGVGAGMGHLDVEDEGRYMKFSRSMRGNLPSSFVFFADGKLFSFCCKIAGTDSFLQRRYPLRHHQATKLAARIAGIQTKKSVKLLAGACADSGERLATDSRLPTPRETVHEGNHGSVTLL